MGKKWDAIKRRAKSATKMVCAAAGAGFVSGVAEGVASGTQSYMTERTYRALEKIEDKCKSYGFFKKSK